MWRITAFLKRHPSLDRHGFIAAARTLCKAIAVHDPAPRRTVINLPMDPLPPALASMFGDRFDAVAELWFEDGSEAAATLGALSRSTMLNNLSARAIDRAGSYAWLAEVVPQIPPPDDYLKFVVAGQAADGMTMLEAQDYWRDDHPDVFRAVADFAPYIVGYTQMHGRDTLVPCAVDWLAAEGFYPLCADMGLNSAEDVAVAYSMPGYLAIVRPDEEKFSKPADMLSFASAEREFY